MGSVVMGADQGKTDKRRPQLVSDDTMTENWARTFGVKCDCCSKLVPEHDIDGLYGCCSRCAFCQSLAQCYVGEDRPENTICCHGDGGCADGGD